MGRLTFIGLGLGGPKDISLRGLETVRAADVVYVEFYTSKLVGVGEGELEGMLGRGVVELSREDVEIGDMVVSGAEGGDVAFLTAGDPMVATTHLDLRMRAIERGVKVRMVHSGSILTAAPGLLGLQHYKFGKTTTIPFPRDNYSPTSPYDAIAANKGMGLHTLALLDIDGPNNRYMTADRGVKELLAMEGRLGRGVFEEGSLVCVVARAGSEEPLLLAGKAGELAGFDFGGPPHCLVIPGELHFMEEEALKKLCQWV